MAIEVILSIILSIYLILILNSILHINDTIYVIALKLSRFILCNDHISKRKIAIEIMVNIESQIMLITIIYNVQVI
jgi:hypothetical protein